MVLCINAQELILQYAQTKCAECGKTPMTRRQNAFKWMHLNKVNNEGRQIMLPGTFEFAFLLKKRASRLPAGGAALLVICGSTSPLG